jgi:hypothetical protein
VIESSRFDYHKLRWVEEPAPTAAQSPNAGNSQGMPEATASFNDGKAGTVGNPIAGKVEKSP